MSTSIEHQLTELGIQLNDVKHRIAECERKAATAPDEQKANLMAEKTALQAKETALLNEMKLLQVRKRGE